MTEQEKAFVLLESAVEALHARVDNVEKDMAEKLKTIGDDVKMLLQSHHFSKGRASAFLAIGGLIGSLAVAGIGHFLK